MEKPARPGALTRVALLVLTVLGLLVALPGSSYAAPHPRAADGSSGSGRVVKVGTEGTYPPFSFRDPKTQQLTGYDLEVVRAVAKEAGWRLQFVTSTFDAIFPALDSGRIDVVANQVTINPERKARYAFSTPYTFSRGVIVVAKGSTGITSLADLKGKTTAESATSNWNQVAKQAGSKVQTVEGFAQAAALVKQGRVDATVNDDLAVLDYLASTGSKDVRIAGNAGTDVSQQALAFRAKDTALRDEADAALAKLRSNGTLAKISRSYFQADVSVEKQGAIKVKASDTGRSTWQVLADTAGPMLVGALKITLPLTAISFALGLLLGLATALARLSRRRVLDLPARFYVSAIRGTPLLVQLFIVFYGLPELGIDLPRFVAAVLALSLNVGGYAAEIIRASILGVPRGQFEAATTIGMDYRTSLRRIVLPQAARIAVPPLSNTLLSLVKDTSLVAVVLLTDLFRVAQNAAAVSGQFMALYLLAAVYYWVICWVLSQVQQRIERRQERYVA